MTITNHKTLKSTEEAADFLNVKVSWIRSMVFRKKLNHVKLGRLIRFEISELEKLISENKKEAK